MQLSNTLHPTASPALGRAALLLSVGICLVLRQEGEVGGYRSQEQLTERKQKRFVFSTDTHCHPHLLHSAGALLRWTQSFHPPENSEVLLRPTASNAEPEP